MIKFFRQIRQRLLAQSKFSKYLLYAIGEIVLVVIGILIALQINNWNESRKLQEEIDTYFAQKLVNLHEDKLRLIELREFRLMAGEKSKQLLDEGLGEANTFKLVKITKLITVERRFVSTVERNETSITKYYWSYKEAEINDLEQQYMNLIELVTFEENRLNTFSEAIELDLWRNGFFIGNRKIFGSMIEDLNQSNFEDTVPELILNDSNGQKSLEGLYRRNELANPSLVLKLNELLATNNKLVAVIEHYLNND